jgi:hypothetical protein
MASSPRMESYEVEFPVPCSSAAPQHVMIWLGPWKAHFEIDSGTGKLRRRLRRTSDDA